MPSLTPDSSVGVPATPRLPLALAVLLFCFGLYSFALDDAPISRQAELRTWNTAEHILQTHEWLAPSLESDGHRVAPSLYFSIAAVAMDLGSHSRDFFRFPAVIAAMFLLVVVYLWGRSLGGPTSGLTAVMLLGLSYLFVRFSRRSVSDMPLALITTWALWMVERIGHEPTSRRRWILALLMILGFLMKGWVAISIIFVPVVVWCIIHGSLRPWTYVFSTWTALFACAGCLGWVAYVQSATGVPWKEALVLSPGPFDSAPLGSRLSLLPQVLMTFLPGTLLLPYVFLRGRETRFWRDEPRMRFLVLGLIALTAITLTLPNLGRHHLLPIFPLLALITSRATLFYVHDHPETFWRAGRGIGYVAGVLFAILTPVTFGYMYIVEGASGLLSFVVAMVALGTSVGLFASLRKRLIRPGMACAVMGLGLIYGLFFGRVDVWQSRFKADCIEDSPEFREDHWESLFESHPYLIGPFRAEEWVASREDR